MRLSDRRYWAFWAFWGSFSFSLAISPVCQNVVCEEVTNCVLGVLGFLGVLVVIFVFFHRWCQEVVG